MRNPLPGGPAKNEEISASEKSRKRFDTATSSCLPIPHYPHQDLRPFFQAESAALGGATRAWSGEISICPQSFYPLGHFPPLPRRKDPCVRLRSQHPRNCTVSCPHP